MKRTYRNLAKQLGLALCPDEDGAFIPACQWPGWSPGLIHWEGGRVTTAGLYRFLLTAAVALDEKLVEVQPEWRRIYLLHQAASRLARQLRVRVPFEQSLLERRRVKALLVGVPSHIPLRKEAFQWARR